MTELSPTSRALLALEIIQSNPGITAERLAGRLDVSERAARRYVTILREAQIPIESVRGPYGGYRVGRGLRLPPLVFSATEALGLVMAVLDGHHQAGDPADPVSSALVKIMRALPQPVAAQAESVRRTASAAPDRAAVRPDFGTTSLLVQACTQQRRARLDYRSEAGSEWVVEMDPWAVVVRHGRWYVLGRVPAKDVVRAYRVDRVRSVQILDGTFVPPKDLDAVAVLEDHLAVGWEYTAEVLIDAPAETVGRYLPRALGRLEPVDAEICRLVGTTGNQYWYAEKLATLTAPFRVVGGVELRAAVRALGVRLVAAGEVTDERLSEQPDQRARGVGPPGPGDCPSAGPRP